MKVANFSTKISETPEAQKAPKFRKFTDSRESGDITTFSTPATFQGQVFEWNIGVLNPTLVHWCIFSS